MTFHGQSKLRPGQFEALSVAMPAPGGAILEIGTLHGVTAARLAAAYPSVTVISVDVFQEINANCWLANRQPNQLLFVGTVQDLATLEPLRRFDLIFVDADHHHKPCLDDLQTSLGLLAPSGRLFCHDYGFREGVTLAVDEFCSLSSRRIVARVDTLVEIGR